jgi:FtsZ-binding cell division protein ZapB
LTTVARLRAEIAEMRALFMARIDELERENAELRRENAELRRENEALKREVAELKKKIIGRTTERSGLRPKKNPPRKPNDAEAQAEREASREARADLPEVDVPHALPDEVKASCPECHGAALTPMPAETSSEVEWVAGRTSAGGIGVSARSVPSATGLRPHPHHRASSTAGSTGRGSSPRR